MTMSMHLLCVILSVALAIYAIHEVYELESNHTEFTINHRLSVNADAVEFFRFLTQDDVLKKLLPWLTRFKEADARALSVGKFYRAFLDLSILGIKKIYLRVVSYRPTKLFILESNHSTITQRIEIRTKSYNGRTIFRLRIYLRKTWIVYHYTVGMALRFYIERHLESSALAVAQMYKAVEEPRRDSENFVAT